MFDFPKTCGLKLIKDFVEGDSNLSRIYGFILYTEQDPYVAKVLRDDDFWNALNSISGANWPIFAVRPLSKGSYASPSNGSGCLRYMIPTRFEPSNNMQILYDFGLKDTENLPLFVAFMWDDDDKLNQVAIPIIGKDVDAVYHSLEEIVKVIAKAEAAVLPQYKRTVNVFRNILTELDALRFKYLLVNRGKSTFRILEFFKSLV